VEPLTDVRDISRIAYGFMASKALFAALEVDLFGHLAGGARTRAELAGATGVAANRLDVLLTILVALGLVVRDGDAFANAPASARYLVAGAKAYFGDYYRLQVDRQIYPALQHLGAALRGEPVDFWRLMDDPGEAERFSRAQHAGSLGPARLLAQRLDLAGCRRLLDVGGGSGAFSLTLCQRHPALTATIVDFPGVREVAERYAREAGLASRVRFLAGSALEVPWPEDQDVVLMSYLLSNFGPPVVADLVGRAWRVLAPGGRLVIHDFVVRDDGTGPLHAALWLLLPVLATPDVAALTPGGLTGVARSQGFGEVETFELVPGITSVVTARKAGGG
jgi:SAM-dependent methyltransferase